MAIKSAMNKMLAVITAILMSTSLFGEELFNDEDEVEHKFNVKEMIMHHIQDAHEWHLWGGHEGTSIYLPIIIVDGGLKVFSSSHFYHGKHVVTVEEHSKKEHEYVAGVGPAEGYAMYHEEIYKLEEDGTLSFEH